MGVAARNAWDAIRLVLERNECQETLEWRIASLMIQLTQAGQLLKAAGVRCIGSKMDGERAAAGLCKTIASRLGVDECRARQTLVRLLQTAPHPVDQNDEDFTPWGDHHLQPVEERAPDLAIVRGSTGSFAVEVCGGRYASINVSTALVARIAEINGELKALRDPRKSPQARRIQGKK